MTLDDDLREIIWKKATAKPEIRRETKLTEIGLDSLDVVEIVFEIEDKFHIQVPQDDETMAAATFGDLCRLVEQQIAGKAPATAPDPQPTT